MLDKGDYESPEQILEAEADLVGEMIRSFRREEDSKGMQLLNEIARTCYVQGRAAERKRTGAGALVDTLAAGPSSD